MRVAILSDVHGNLVALEAVLADLQRQAPDLVVVNGDMVNRGPDNVAVLERLHDLGAPLILGNHDDLVRMWVDRDPALPREWFSDPFWRATAWTAGQLQDAGLIDSLRELPQSYRLELPDAPSVLIVHGSPRHYRESLDRHLTDQAIEELGEEFGAPILVGSHTHIPLDRRHRGYWILNSGAVGVSFNGDPRAHYLLIDLRDWSWTPTFRRVEYDRGRALARFEESGFLENGGLSARIFREEVKIARSLLTPYMNWAQACGLPTNEDSFRLFRAANPHRFLPLTAPYEGTR